mgnify:CR=1 FL=1
MPLVPGSIDLCLPLPFLVHFLLQVHLYRNEIRSASGGGQRELSKGARGILTILGALSNLFVGPHQKRGEYTNKAREPRREIRRRQESRFIVLRNGREEEQEGRQRPVAQPHWGAEPQPDNQEEAAKRGLDGGDGGRREEY